MNVNDFRAQKQSLYDFWLNVNACIFEKKKKRKKTDLLKIFTKTIIYYVEYQYDQFDINLHGKINKLKRSFFITKES